MKKLTVAEVLDFDALGGHRVIAGRHRLDQSVGGVRLWMDLDLTDAATEQLLVWPAPAKQVNLKAISDRVRIALERHSAALVILSNSEDVDIINGSEVSNADLPVVQVPYSQPPLEMIYQLQSQLLEHVTRIIDRIDQIHRALTMVAMAGGDLHVLTQTLANLIENPVSIRSMHLEVLTDAMFGELNDDARQRTISEGKVPADVQDALKGFNFESRIRHERGPFKLPAIPEVGMRGRVVAPIRISAARYGYISIAECNRPLGTLDMEAVERAALVAALILSQRQAIERDKLRLRSNFANELIFGNGDRNSLRLLDRSAKILKYDNDSFSVLTMAIESIELLSNNGEQIDDQSDLLLNQIVISIDRVWQDSFRQVRPLVLKEHDGIVILHPIGLDLMNRHEGLGQYLKQSAESYMHRVEQLVGEDSVWIGIGRPYYRQQVRDSYNEGCQALAIGRSLQLGRVTYYQDLGVYRLLDTHSDATQLHAFAEEQLGALLHYDAERCGELVRTLRLYLNTGRNKAKTAALLPSHLNTVKYRLEQIREITGRDPDDASQQLAYHVALAILELQPDGPAMTSDRSP